MSKKGGRKSRDTITLKGITPYLKVCFSTNVHEYQLMYVVKGLKAEGRSQRKERNQSEVIH